VRVKEVCNKFFRQGNHSEGAGGSSVSLPFLVFYQLLRFSIYAFCYAQIFDTTKKPYQVLVEYFSAKFCPVHAVHTIENELGDPSLIQPVIRASLAMCSSIYILTALFGFLLFGESTLDDVLANFDTDLGIPYSSLLNDIVRISYALHLMLVFPVIFFSLRFNLDDLIFPSSRSLDLDNRRFVLITIGLITLIYLAANFLPSIWDVFQFTGATATVCLGFIFPAAVSIRWVFLLYLNVVITSNFIVVNLIVFILLKCLLCESM